MLHVGSSAQYLGYKEIEKGYGVEDDGRQQGPDSILLKLTCVCGHETILKEYSQKGSQGSL